jgi:hypothetical protein
MKKILLLLILSSSFVLSAKNSNKIKDINFKSKNETVKNYIKVSELTEDEELELFGYEFARALESRNDISEKEKIEIRLELGLPMTE